MPIISVDASYKSRHRQSIPDNDNIQLPLIETQQRRVIFLPYFVSHIILLFLSQYQKMPCQDEQQNHSVFHPSNVDEIQL
jgi:hypothetical protein